MTEICKVLSHRIFLRTSRAEILRRRQSSQTLAEPFVEHVFWPMHLQYGQPQATWKDICIDEATEGYPVPETILSEALGILDFDAPSTKIATARVMTGYSAPDVTAIAANSESGPDK